jgi:signal transduction histidine kinase
MNQRLARVERTFIVSIVGLVIVALATLTGTLLITNLARYDRQVSAQDISTLTQTYPEVAAYLDSQKPAEPHFVTIATLVKQSQERAILQIVLLAALPITIASAGIGVLISRKLLRPVSESYEAQERFIQDAAHELRNPLAAMSATLETAKLPKRQTPADMRETVERLERQTARLIQINEDLLYLQRRADASNARHINISRLAEELVKDFLPLAREKDITFNPTITPGMHLTISPKDFEIVLRNLLDNAFKYTPNKGTVSCSLTRRKDQTILRIRDSGIGIPDKELVHVTERFYRAANTSSQPGSGLGLALVQKVVEAYGAKLLISSKPGHGTTVRVIFS